MLGRSWAAEWGKRSHPETLERICLQIWRIGRWSAAAAAAVCRHCARATHRRQPWPTAPRPLPAARAQPRSRRRRGGRGCVAGSRRWQGAMLFLWVWQGWRWRVGWPGSRASGAGLAWPDKARRAVRPGSPAWASDHAGWRTGWLTDGSLGRRCGAAASPPPPPTLAGMPPTRRRAWPWLECGA